MLGRLILSGLSSAHRDDLVAANTIRQTIWQSKKNACALDYIAGREDNNGTQRILVNGRGRGTI